jgi:2-oxoglutarate dehydrogenase E2 component (dihydrolipoamide succinyltransferase)
MSISIVVPQLGESVAEGTVSRWLKAQGDKVRKEEPIVEIQTDKINVEIPSPADGVLSEILVQEGTTVLVGTEIARLGDGASGGAAPAAAAAQAPKAAAAPATAPAPARAAQAAPAAAPTPAPVPAPARAAALAAPAPHYGSFGNGGGGDGIEGRNLSPSVRRLMRENEISAAELDAIHGSGMGGRVTRDDLLDYLRRRPAEPARGAAPPAAAPAAPPAPSAVPSFLRAQTGAAATGERTEVVPFTKVRKLIAVNMVRAKQTAAHTHCFDETDMSAIVALRKEWGPKLEAQGIKLTYMPFFIKAAVFALREFPWVNGEVRDDTIVVKHYYNIGMAVGRDEKGLIVPNIKDCDRKNLAQLAHEVNDLASRARNDRLKPDDIQDGTFSITNAGVYGAINSSPVINVPEVAILGVHKIVERPVVKDGQIVVRPMMNASIGFDHRVIDGEVAVKFLRRLCELLERPELLWFQV